VKIQAVAALAALALAACDNPKPRQVPPDPMALAPPPLAPAAAPTDGMSAGLARRPEFPGFYLDRIGSAPDPVNKQPAVTSGAQPMVLDGFGFDPVAKVPAKGVDVVIDGKAYGTAYGQSRPDVASFHRVPALAPTGYAMTLPAGTLAKGPHTALVRVIAADGKGYFESPVINFTVN
jgi:hypothetical protein